MKKLLAVMMIFALALTGTTAFAATYIDRDRDLTFEYDDAKFEIAMDDQTDDELLVILSGKDEAWGDTYVRIHLAELDDGEKFPTMDDFQNLVDSANVQVTQGEWNGYKDVYMYTSVFEGGQEQVFIVPVYDDDEPEVESILTLNIGISDVADEAVAMDRDDNISAVVDTLKLLDD